MIWKSKPSNRFNGVGRPWAFLNHLAQADSPHGLDGVVVIETSNNFLDARVVAMGFSGTSGIIAKTADNILASCTKIFGVVVTLSEQAMVRWWRLKDS